MGTEELIKKIEQKLSSMKRTLVEQRRIIAEMPDSFDIVGDNGYVHRTEGSFVKQYLVEIHQDKIDEIDTAIRDVSQTLGII